MMEGLGHFWRFAVVMALLGLYWWLSQTPLWVPLAVGVAYAATLIGMVPLLIEMFETIRHKRIGVDFLALIAIVFGLILGEYFAALIIVVMTVGGDSLEHFAEGRAKRSLSQLVARIPQTVTRYIAKRAAGSVSVKDVRVGDHILLRKGEVSPFDGELLSESGLFDESALTGESNAVEKENEAKVWSGTVNLGDAVVLAVTARFESSVYAKIINEVARAHHSKTPFTRLADRFSLIFTLVAFGIAAVAWFLSHDIVRVFAVFVVATPCPLILATPIALFGGVHRATNAHMIVKHLAAIEIMSRVNTIVVDKTGTLTLGTPSLHEVKIHGSMKREEALSIAASIEQYSLHPVARALVAKAVHEKVKLQKVTKVSEKIGKGIAGRVGKHEYRLQKINGQVGLVIGMYRERVLVAEFHFVESAKKDADRGIERLLKRGITVQVLSGDKPSNVAAFMKRMFPRHALASFGGVSPEGKLKHIKDLKKSKAVVAMVGDGINDAPALAAAHVGIVFSRSESSAATDAGDVVLLASDVSRIDTLVTISRETIAIAYQSIFVGIGLSIVLMVFAALGHIPPVMGAILQEGLDLIVIFNALRASR